MKNIYFSRTERYRQSHTEVFSILNTLNWNPPLGIEGKNCLLSGRRYNQLGRETLRNQSTGSQDGGIATGRRASHYIENKLLIKINVTTGIKRQHFIFISVLFILYIKKLFEQMFKVSSSKLLTVKQAIFELIST